MKLQITTFKILTVFLFLPQAAQGSCLLFKRHLPALYKAYCKGSGVNRPSGTSASFADSFNMNPASTPTDLSPWGLEGIGSYVRRDSTEWAPNFTILKGFKRFGTGVSTAANSTFFGNDIARREDGPTYIHTWDTGEESKGYATNLNLGFAVALIKPGKSSTFPFELNLGLSARYNKLTHTVGPGTGLMTKIGLFNFGVGISRERVSNRFGPVYFGSVTAGMSLLFLELDYTVLRNYRGPFLPNIHIATGILNLGPVSLVGAVRRVHYNTAGEVRQRHFGVQVFLTKKFALGALWNYFPGTNSIAMQIYL